MGDYEKLIERISNSANVDKEEIEKKVEAKRVKLSGLISREGAVQIIAAELGISFDSERLKISELSQGMKRANIIGKITKIFPVREYKKNDKEGKIGSFLLGDESSNVRVVMWDLSHISLIEKEDLKEGDVVEIVNGNVRNGEVHLSAFSDVKHSNELVENVKTDREFFSDKIENAKVGNSMKVRAVMVQNFEPRYFESKRKEGEKGVVWNIVLDDGTESIRAVLFGEVIKTLGFSDEELFSVEMFNKKREELLGEEKLFSGNFRMNNFFNRMEMAIDNVEDFDVDELIKELEAKV